MGIEGAHGPEIKSDGYMCHFLFTARTGCVLHTESSSAVLFCL